MKNISMAREATAPGDRMRMAREWIETVCLALATGLVVSLVLVVVAMLLSYDAAAAEGGTGRAPEVGLTLRSGNGRTAAPLVHTDVELRITGIVARAKVTQTFENPFDDWYEGVYVFPLPEGAAVDRLKMRVGDRIIEGEIRERSAAKRAYESAKADGQRAALVDAERPNVFTTSVANIAPHARIAVEIEYQDLARYDQGAFRTRFPMVVGPRYSPAGSLDSHRVTPPVLRPQTSEVRATPAVHNPLNLRVELDAGAPIASVTSTYHDIVTAKESDGRVRLALRDGVVPADRDFELVWKLEASRAPRALAYRESHAGKDYALVMVVPPAVDAAVQRLPREAIFIIDTSGSMDGTSIVQAREALRLALGRLQPSDRFNVIEFNSNAQALYATAQPATDRNVADARRWVAGLRAQGGTEMAKALDLALDGRSDETRIRQIVFLTDGAVSNEAELFRMLTARLGGSRLFTVGIGSAPNSHFMSQAAALGGGTFTYIGKIDEVAERMGALFAKLESPMLKNVRVEWTGGTSIDAFPQRIPDLYAGEPVLVAMRGDAIPNTVRVSGNLGDARWEQAVTIGRAVSERGIGKLWARRRIEALQFKSDADEEVVRRSIIEVALEHALVTSYTSLVAIDKTPARTPESALRSGNVPTNLPEGWSYEAVYGELPQTATDARLSLLIGLAALLAALSLTGWQRRSLRVAP